MAGMPHDEPQPSDPTPNPYSAPNSDPGAPHRGGPIPLPAGQHRGMVGQAVVVGVLMAVQGAINLVAGVIAAIYSVFMPYVMEDVRQQAAKNAGQGAAAPLPENFGLYFGIAFGLAAVVLFGLGILLIYSGYNVARYQRRTLAIIALMSGLVTLFTCYCFPTSLALGIYGMIFLLNQPVGLAFELRSQGYSPTEIQRSFFNLR